MKPGETLELRIDDTGEPRLDTYATRESSLTRSQIQRLIDEGHVLVNGARPAKAGQKLQVGDSLSVHLPAPRPSSLTAEAIPLTILFQDEHLAVIEKPSGLVVHPSAGHDDGTLVNALLHHLGQLSGIGGEQRPGIVHRIDKNTSGILLVTKTDAAHQALSLQFQEHTVTRRYRGLCWGRLAPEGRFEGAIGRDPKERKRMAVVEGGKSAITLFKSLAHYSTALTAFEAELKTGRTHQVRVHFSAQGHPLVGDVPYCSATRAARLKRDTGMKALERKPFYSLLLALEEKERQFLHAAYLAFTHPVSGERLEFSSELPEELAAVMAGLEAW